VKMVTVSNPAGNAGQLHDGTTFNNRDQDVEVSTHGFGFVGTAC
jgi:hypothetical protein